MRVLAFDFGASSGRAVLGERRGDTIAVREIHRFVNRPLLRDGALRWDLGALLDNLREGIVRAVAAGGFDRIGIDTWGVDYGLVDRTGDVAGDPACYRDPRFEAAARAAEARMPAGELYARTGIQRLAFNTVYRLFDEARRGELAGRSVLLMPDLFAWYLTGTARTELTAASTTGLLNARTREPDRQILAGLGIPDGLFPPRILPGESYGALRPELCRELGCPPVDVVAVCSHDTASAVAALPAEEPGAAYLSAGTWSLMGTELDAPLFADPRFSNELGYGGSVRYLKNIMGSWILQELRRELSEGGPEVSFADLEKMANGRANDAYFDVDEPLFLAPGAMKPRIAQALRRTGQRVPADDAGFVRCVYENLALKHAAVLAALGRAAGRRFARLYALGGGTQSALLMRLSAEACGIPVIAGPAEATAVGNAAVQLIAAGEIADLTRARAMIARDPGIRRYRPARGAVWCGKFADYLQKTEVTK